jgi:alpha-glucosidase
VFGGPAWHRAPDGQWYLHLFAPEQPDLDWSNREVRDEFLEVLRFWLDRGVDGFRIDVAHGLGKDLALPDLGDDRESILEPTKRIDHPHWDRDEVLEIYAEWREVLDSYDGERMLVAEAWVATPERLARYVSRGHLHTAFNFDFVKAPWTAERLREVIDSNRAANDAVGAPTTWVLSNHDVTRHVTRFGRPQRGGTFDRNAATEPVDLELGTRRARAAALLMLALPGGAYVYQGEELGLEEVEDIPDDLLQDPVWLRSGHTQRGRDGCRVPLPWSGDASPFGFGPEGSTPWLPQPARWKTLTAERQAQDPGSMLELYRSALRLRHASAALGDGKLTWLAAPDGVLAFAREPGFACWVNLAPDPVPLPDDVQVLLASGPLHGGTLPSDTAVWLTHG